MTQKAVITETMRLRRLPRRGDITHRSWQLTAGLPPHPVV